MKISEFSKICGVPAKTLRYYDEIGLLSPERVEPGSGYRIYSIDQLPRLNKILQYRQLGFSLSLIKTILNGDTTLEEVQGMLRQRNRVIQDRIEEELERLHQVEAAQEDLSVQLSEKSRSRGYEIITRSIDPVLVVSMQDHANGLTDSGRILVKISKKVIQHIMKQNCPMSAPGIALYHSFSEQRVDLEFAQPVEYAIEPAGKMECKTLPGIELAACVYHYGALNEIDHAHQALMDWVRANDYEVDLPVRDVYLRYDPRGKGHEFITEVQYPIRKRQPVD
jgi:DNA-binding transcriptional MerR regulator